MYTFKINNLETINNDITEEWIYQQLDTMKNDNDIVSGDIWFGTSEYDVNIYGAYYGAEDEKWRGVVYEIVDNHCEEQLAEFDIEIFKDGVQIFSE